MHVRASVPGKIILHGEHSVVHGTPAIAIAIDRWTNVDVDLQPEVATHFEIRLLHRLVRIPYSAIMDCTARCQLIDSACNVISGQRNVMDEVDRAISMADIEHDTTARCDAIPQDIVDNSVRVIVFLFVGICSRKPDPVSKLSPISMIVSSEIPIGAGLGSSASFSAAVASALLAVSGQIKDLQLGSRQLVNRWAYEAERIIHGSPSGIDNFVVVHGGAARYQKGADPEQVPAPSSQRLLVVNTRISRSTKRLIAGVDSFLKSSTQTALAIFSEIDDIVRKATTRLKDPNGATICGKLIRANHKLLCDLGVGHSAIDDVVGIAEKHGFPAKLTGAGGGGCVICLVPLGSDTGDFLQEITKSGYDGFETLFNVNGMKTQIGNKLL